MANRSRIAWTDATWNPVTGCTKVSAGCKHCYAERDWARLAANPQTRYHGRAFTDVRYHLDTLEQPLRWTKPRRIFVCSMADLFHDAVPDLVIADVFAVMAAAPRHTFQVLTKRPQRAAALLNDPNFRDLVEDALALHTDVDLAWPLPNLWFGVTTEDQAAADERIPLLLDIPAAVRWLSVEPMIGPIDLHDIKAPAEAGAHDVINWRFDSLQAGSCYWFDCGNGKCDIGDGPVRMRVDWIVVAGESGPQARPMHPEWARGLRDQCSAAGVPFLFKQWGEFAPSEYGPSINEASGNGHAFVAWPDGQIAHGTAEQHGGVGTLIHRVGKKAAGRLLDGVLHDEYPEARA